MKRLAIPHLLLLLGPNAEVQGAPSGIAHPRHRRLVSFSSTALQAAPAMKDIPIFRSSSQRRTHSHRPAQGVDKSQRRIRLRMAFPMDYPLMLLLG